ncbi:hypothetical protein NDU88_005831 [Pleurodeles waltl]|uniref:Uncharacterized protein n=1 Tax=Pleurodeles waltl TaxID=8319 RepID=A0AAV7VP12_PLEWA|nr:hypothetical protein NDU88_005831 [Pleurodeles waltl]
MEASIPSIRQLTAVISCSIRSIVVGCSLSDVVMGWIGGGDEWVSVVMEVGRFWWSASENNSCGAGLPAGLWFGLLPGIALLVCEDYPVGPEIFFGVQWRADRGVATTRLRPPGRPLLARRPRAFQVTVAGRFSLGSGARRFLKSSDAGQVIRRCRCGAPAASPGSPQHGAQGLGGHLPS